MQSSVQSNSFWQQKLSLACRKNWLGREVRAYVSCPSTQTLALQWAQQGASHGSVVVATEQTAGYGQQKRCWWTGEGGVAVSIVLRPQQPNFVHSLGLQAAAGLLEILQKRGLFGKIKWPNDVLLPVSASCNTAPIMGRYGKWAGILAQSIWSGKQLESVVLGIGMNVHRPRFSLPFMARHAVFLSDFDIDISPQLLLEDVLHGLQNIFDESSKKEGRKRLIDCIRRQCLTLNQQIEIQLDNTTQHARAIDITPSGALVVQLCDGTLQEVHSGQATILTSQSVCSHVSRGKPCST